jgi:glycosyltransferase involved in cell wall biosynthesis
VKVLILSEPGESGVFAYVESLCHFLIERGVAVHFGYSDQRASDRLATLVAFVEAQGGRTVNMAVGNAVGPRDLRAFFRVWHLAVELQPDVIHCHSSKAGVIGRMLAFTGLRTIHVYHPHAYYGMRPVRGPIAGIYNLIETALSRVGSTIVVSGDEARFAVRKLGLQPNRLKLIRNGVDTDRFVPASPEEKLRLRDSFGVPRGRVLLGAMSRMSLQKDPITMYRAFAAACREDPDLHLLHVGTGELEGDVERIVAAAGIESRVTRVRYLSDPTGFYKAIDGFVLTSHYEGLSLAILEAMSVGSPLILSRAMGNIDLLELPLSHTWAASPGDVPGFQRAFLAFRERHRQGVPSNHREMAIGRFEFRSTLGQVLSYYGEIKGGSAGISAASVWIPVLAWLAMIAAESTDRFSRAHTRVLLFPPVHFLTGVSYGDFYGWNFFIRKAGHVLLYGSLGAVLYRLLRRYVPGARRTTWSAACAGLAVLGTAFVASLDEWHQTFIPSRTGTVQDVMLDTSAAIAAQVLILGACRLRWPSRGEAGAAGRFRPQSQPTPPTPSELPGMAAESTESRASS